jgi:prophage antirepressor-like protein
MGDGLGSSEARCHRRCENFFRSDPNFSQSHDREVRVAVQGNNEPWFVGKDVCEVLGIGTSNLTKVLDEDERCRTLYKPMVDLNQW